MLIETSTLKHLPDYSYKVVLEIELLGVGNIVSPPPRGHELCLQHIDLAPVHVAEQLLEVVRLHASGQGQAKVLGAF